MRTKQPVKVVEGEMKYGYLGCKDGIVYEAHYNHFIDVEKLHNVISGLHAKIVRQLSRLGIRRVKVTLIGRTKKTWRFQVDADRDPAKYSSQVAIAG